MAKTAEARRKIPRGDKLVTLMCIVNRLDAHEARLSCVGSCRMTLRVLFAGALTALPLLVSGALAQELASPPAVTISPAPSASPPPPAATPPSRPRLLRRFPRIRLPQPPLQRRRPIRRPHQPRPKGSQVLSCLRRRSPPTAGTETAPGASPSAAAPIPSAQAARAEAEESRAARAAARDRAQRRSSPNPSARHLLRHRQGVRALFGDRGRGRLANRHRGDRPRNEGPGGGETAQAPGDRRRPLRGRSKRPCLGQRTDGRGEALPGAHGIAPDRHRLRRDAEGHQHSGEGALQSARLERQPPRRAQFLLR